MIKYIIPLMILISGCMSPGRVALLDIDLRTPEQIKAYEVEAQVPFKDTDIISKDPEPKSVSAWSFVSPIIQVFKGRIRILSVEWQGNQKESEK